jgi:hypothetical protein
MVGQAGFGVGVAELCVCVLFVSLGQPTGKKFVRAALVLNQTGFSDQRTGIRR